MSRVLVLGSSGFVGEATCSALQRRGHQVVRMKAPRLDSVSGTSASPLELTEFRERLRGVDAVVNAAGVPEATGSDAPAMAAANGILPGLLASACTEAGIRFVHVSSAAVQGRRPCLDASLDRDVFSPYSASKAMGEDRALEHLTTVVYRPPGVHGLSRSVTHKLARLARSRLSSVAGVGDAPSAQALIENVGDAIAYLAVTSSSPPPIVSHPSEGLTVSSLLEALGGRRPLRVPVSFARSAVSCGYLVGRVRPKFAGHARRLEMMWFGQAQAPSWLTEVGWNPPLGRESWRELGRRLAADALRKDSA